MSSGQGLLQDIIDHPGDDTLRRIYADWLDDDGQHDRAEFVRVQLDLAGLEEDDPRRVELIRRSYQLQALHEEQWLRGLTREGFTVQFERGLPGRISADAATFLRHAEEAFSRCPVVELTLEGLNGDLLPQQVIDSPLLDRVERLSLSFSGLSEWNLVKLFQSRTFSRLRALDLT